MDLHAATELFQAAAAAATAGRLIQLGLARQFPGLLAYLAFIAASDLASGALNQRSHIYFLMYVSVTPLESIFNIFAVRELLMVTFKSYPGIRTLGRWAMYGGIGVAGIVSVAMTKYLWVGDTVRLAKLAVFYNEVASRSISLILAVVVVAVIFVLSKYPLHLGKNIYISFGFFSALFLSDAIRLCVDGLAPALYNNYADWTGAILTALFLVSWAILLRPYEAPAARVGFSSPHEEQLMQQLNSLNDLMSRASRR